MDEPSKKRLFSPGIIIAAMGVVYGDIGTSPLYAFRICFSGKSGIAVSPDNVLGILSLIFWSLFLLISLKYLSFVLRADNRGEGGILALLTLLIHKVGSSPMRRGIVVFLGLFGASLLYGDGLITPVISVLSAIEGLSIITPAFNVFVLPISLAILITLFWFQRKGSGNIGAVFGPVMVVWFVVIALLGVMSIVKNPMVFASIDPRYAFSFFAHNNIKGFLTLGSVFLVLTGGEALFADMGHFGKKPIQQGWFYFVFPALMLNYFGQGSYLLLHPENIDNLFYRLAPQWSILPMVILATMATVIASQACISGAFSLARQSVQLGFCPRLNIVHTSSETIGQVYVPEINGLLCLGSIFLVIGFKTSDSLAGAYGVAVATTMLITTMLLFLVMRRIWKWPLVISAVIFSVFFTLDLAFFSANIIKVLDGGWVSIVVAVTAFTLMTTWDRGRVILRHNVESAAVSMKDFISDVKTFKPTRVPGTAVFLAGNPTGTPRTLLHNFKHNKVIHNTVVCLTVTTEEVPRVEESKRIDVSDLGNGFFWITARYGFSETPDVPQLLLSAKSFGINCDMMQTTFFLGRETLIPSQNGKMPQWRKGVFAFLSRNACDASKFFHIPPNRVIEIGIQIEL